MIWILYVYIRCGHEFYTADNGPPAHSRCVTCRKADGLEPATIGSR